MPLELTLRDDGSEFMALVKRCYQDKPDKADMQELERTLADKSELYRKVFALADVVQKNLIGKITSTRPMKAALAANVEIMQEKLGYRHCPELERLLIDNIINAWLRYQHAEYQAAELIGSDSTFELSRHCDRKLTEAQRRYLRAIETLAKVRKLALPALQVNINTDQGQQVNIAGDLVKAG